MSYNLRFLLTLAKTQTILSRKFDRGMGNGIGFNDFLILFHLSQAERKTMRRIDLADKLGITASGITRLLLPMEKIGLVTSGANTEDARVKMVTITKSGEEKMQEAKERLELFLTEILAGASSKEIENTTNLLFSVGGKVLMN
jgi:DNA-binding MarR family transcriptional regulator